jgi:hypothetical protein
VSNTQVMSSNDVSSSGMSNPMRRPKVPLPKPQVWQSHPFVNPKNHLSLLDYLKQRLFAGADARNRQVSRMVDIDKKVAGWMRLSDGDRKRKNKQRTDGNPIPTDVNLPLAWTHIDDMMTYFAQTFAPTQGMFYQTGNPDEQNNAKQVVTVMNNHAIYAGYYPEVLMGLFNLLKYNMGGYHVEWSRETGPKLVKDAQGQDQITQELAWQGNRMEAIDNYNFIFDPSCNIKKIYCEAEFAGVIKSKGFHWLQDRAAKGIYFNCDEALNQTMDTNQWTWYLNPPVRAEMQADESGDTDWKAVLSESTAFGQGIGFELSTIYIRLNPTEFGLVKGNAAAQIARNRLELWRFTICNNKWIIEAQQMNNIHGYIPYFTGFLNDDLMTTSTKSVAEQILPMQDFASSLINTHIKANRKNLWGNTYYDPTMFDMKGIPEGEVSGRIPMNPSAYGRDIKTGIYHDTNILDSKQTLQDLTGVVDVINQFFPGSQLPSQIGNIDRAIDSQVAAVQQGVNRRQQKNARLLDEIIFRPMRFGMYYNIIQYLPDNTQVLDYYTGKTVQLDLNAIRQTDLPFIIGQGLKAIDRQAVASNLQKLIFALIQNPAAAAEVDILSMINFWSSMIDIDADMTQFAKKMPPAAIDPATGQPIPPADAGGAGAAQGASTPGAGAVVQPMVNPAAITAPLRGGKVV